MSSEETLSAPYETSGEVINITSSGENSLSLEENYTSNEDSEILEVNSESSEIVSETTQEVICQVDVSGIENRLDIVICLSLFLSVYLIGTLAYRLVKDIFY